MVRSVILAGAALAAAVLGGGLVTIADEGVSREIPEAFAPFEHMVGGWKGMAIPAANRLKGWEETHHWAWKFAKGVPVGMSLELKNDKMLTRAQLTYDDAAQRYRLEGTDVAGKPVVYVGGLEKKALVLNRVGPAGEGKDRITIRPNANMIRYTMDFDNGVKFSLDVNTPDTFTAATLSSLLNAAAMYKKVSGSATEKQAVDLITIDSMTDDTGHQLPNIIYPGLDRGELVEWVERFYGEYFFRPRVIWRIVKKAMFDGDERKRLTKEARAYMALRSKRRKFVAAHKAAKPETVPASSGD